MAFQPIVDLRDGSIAAFEALTRPGKGSGFSDPEELFRKAGAMGLLWPLEERVRAQALRAVEAFPAGVRLFFNSTPEVLADSRFHAAFQHAISGPEGVGRERLVLEITELCGEESMEALADQVTRLKNMGLEVAIDDVGAGTSGLNRVMLLRPQWLKLDHEFIKGIDTDSFKQNLVRFFVHFSRLSCVNVVAEGIETKEELGAVVMLGIRFGQGYFLARPAALEEVTTQRYAERVSERWAEVEAITTRAPGTALMRRLCVPASTTEAATTVGTVAALLERDERVSGMVVIDGRRYVGWCESRRVHEAMQQGRGGQAIGSLATLGVCAISPEATVQEALHLISTRETDELSQPLVVADAGSVIGIVPIRDLLEAAATEGLQGSGSRVAVSGLPNRVKADQHVAMLVEGASQARAETELGLGDAAFVDIRRFSQYNATYGYNLGDRVIRDLTEMLRTIVAQDEPGIFLSHLGDDRFLITAPPAILSSRLHSMMDEFDRCYKPMPLIEGVEPETSDADPIRTTISTQLTHVVPFAGLCLRVLLIPDAFARIDSSRELYQIEQQLRQRSIREERLAKNRCKSILLRDTRGAGARSLRQSA